MGQAGLAPSARSARKWRLASAAIEETDIDITEDADEVPPREEAKMAGGSGEENPEEYGGGSRWSDGGARGGAVEKEDGDAERYRGGEG